MMTKKNFVLKNKHPALTPNRLSSTIDGAEKSTNCAQRHECQM